MGVGDRVLLDNDTVDATLLAQVLSFGPDGQDERLSGLIGGHLFDQVTDSVQIFDGVEFGTGIEVVFRADAQAGVRISL